MPLQKKGHYLKYGGTYAFTAVVQERISKDRFHALIEI